MSDTAERLTGNMLVAQSGGPTAVANASIAGVIQEAGRHPEAIEEIYGALNGIQGILNEDLVDLQEEKSKAIEGLKHTPGAALGTSRYHPDLAQADGAGSSDVDRLFEVFQAQNIRYLFYVGGNDSQGTALKIQRAALERNWAMRVIGVPKTVDNDLPQTDHSPGYGSAVKYATTTVTEIATDIGSMAGAESSCCVIETMGRDTGWIAAGTALARTAPEGAPHVILLPEIPLEEEAFLDKVKAIASARGFCIVVVGEGLKDKDGKELGAHPSLKDAFGRPLLSGVGEKIADLVQTKLGLKARAVKLGYAQRCAAHCSSAADVADAVACGEAAVRAAVEGKSGAMVKIVRTRNDPYEATTEMEDLQNVANAVQAVPRTWIGEDGFFPNETFITYVRPLIQGEVDIPLEAGLPKFVKLAKVRVEKKLPAPGEAATPPAEIAVEAEASTDTPQPAEV